MDYVRITAQEAAEDVTGVEQYQAGQWCAVESVVLMGDTTGIRYVGGGTHAAPSRYFMFRRAVVMPID